jgi:hypothetical protein
MVYLKNCKYRKYGFLISFKLDKKAFEFLQKESRRDRVSLSQIVRWAIEDRYNLGD